MQKMCQKKLNFCFAHFPLFFRPVPYLQDLITQDLFIKKIWPIYFCKYFWYILIRMWLDFLVNFFFFFKGTYSSGSRTLEAANKNMKVGVIVIGKQYFLKLETITVHLKVGCLAEAISHLCACIQFLLLCIQF
jgi:hypothetical protein